MTSWTKTGRGVCAILAWTWTMAALGAGTASAQNRGEAVPFGSERWTIADGKTVEALGRPAFMGGATLRDVEFENGVIEFDVAVPSDRVRSYPGVTFRIRPGGEWERVYIRPHRSALYGDVLQYVAAFHGVDSWQFYSGPGATALAVIPTGQWLHVRLEVSGSQARVFLGSSPDPALVIPHLRHGSSRGAIGVMGPADGSAYFSNFSYRTGDLLAFTPPPPVHEVPGVVREWMVSKVLPADAIDLEKTPEQQGLKDLAWTRMAAEPGGLVDVSRLHGRANGGGDAVFARATVTADRDETRRFDIGYSDIVTVFVNGTPIFTGNSAYQGRDSSFLGIAGWYDSVFLPLRKGTNELTLAVAEASGGWGFMVRDGTAVFAAPGIVKAWQTPKAFAFPESVAYDAARNCLYVSNYDPANPSGGDAKQAIARIGLDGRILDARWVTGLKNPTGLVVVGDRLYAVERQGIAEIDVTQAKVVTRHPIPNAGLLNDIAAAPDGSLYVTDSLRATIHRLANGEVTPWLQDRRLSRANGLVIDGQRLIVGTNGDGCVKAIGLASKEIVTVAALGAGIIDGIAVTAGGQYLVSHNEGRLFRVTDAGSIIRLLDTTVVGTPIADFTLAGDLLVVPTFGDHRVVAYRVGLLPDASRAAGRVMAR